MPDPCPNAEAWASLLDRDGLPEPLLAHLDGCASCRAEVRALLEVPGRRRRSWIWVAAAASLLVAAWLAFPAGRKAVSLPAPAPSAPILASPPSSLEEGRIWIHAETRRVLKTPYGDLVLEGGDAALRLGPGPRVAGFLREAWAGSRPPLTLLLLEGTSARLDKSSWVGPCAVQGDEAGFRQGPLTEPLLAEAVSWRDEAEGAGPWRELPAGAVSDRLLVPAPAGALVLEAEIEAPGQCQTALCFPDAKGTRFTVVGGFEGGGPQVLRLRLYPGRLEVLSGTRILVSSALPEEARRISDVPSIGLKVWGGPVQVRRLRWRPLK